MAGTEQQIDASVRVRFTPAQILILAPGLYLLFKSLQEHKRLGASRLSYPFRNLPPARGFDRGTYSQSFIRDHSHTHPCLDLTHLR